MAENEFNTAIPEEGGNGALSPSSAFKEEPFDHEEKEDRSSVIEELHELAYAEAEALDYLPKPIGALKKRSNPFLKLFTAFLMVFIVVIFILARMVFGRGWILNAIKKEGNFRSFSIPISSHPKLEDEFYRPDGRFTVEGVYNACSPSVVTIECFVDDTVFSAYGQGSGIIMTSDGYIITNAHVIDDAKLAIIVRLSSGKEYSAKVIGSDTKSDLAVLKINASGLSPVVFGDSTLLKMGEEVVTIGSPAGFELSTTSGVVSGLNRMVRVESNNISMDCIQIDAAINPGSSGGALFNMWGQLVGITSSKMVTTEYENIGFAISMDAAKPIIEELIENGSILGRPKVGISFYEVSDSVATVYDMPAGLHIAEILPDCDIANTNLAVDDVITEMNGIKVRSADDVFAIINKLHPGDMMTAKVIRVKPNGDWVEFEISFKLMDDNSSAIQPDDEISDEVSEDDTEE